MAMTIERFTREYEFLSNFYPSPFRAEILGEMRDCLTVEHGFQASKFVLRSQVDKVLEVERPRDAKLLGRRLKPLRADWERVKLEVMETMVRAKFEQNLHLRGLLRATGNAHLAEGNRHGDRYWGRVVDTRSGQWSGRNHLGQILMKVRDEL